MDGASIGLPQDKSPYTSHPLLARLDVAKTLALPTYHPEFRPPYDEEDVYIWDRDLRDDVSERSTSTCSSCSITRATAERLRDKRPVPQPFERPLPPLPPLQDSYTRYFGGLENVPGASKDNPWLKRFSARVTDIAATTLPGPSTYSGKARVRVIVGCEDGVVRIFAGTDDTQVASAIDHARLEELVESPEVLADPEVRTIRGSSPGSSPMRFQSSTGSSRALSPGSPTRSLMRLGVGVPNGVGVRDRSVSVASASTSTSRPGPYRSMSNESLMRPTFLSHEQDSPRGAKGAPTVSVSETDAEAEIPLSPPPPPTARSRRGGHRSKPSISISALNAVTVPSSKPLLEGLRSVSSSSISPTDASPPPSPTSPHKRPPLPSAGSSTSFTSQTSPALDAAFTFSSLDGRPSLEFASDRDAPDPWEGIRLQHLIDVDVQGRGAGIVALQVVDHAVDACDQDDEVPEARAVVCLTDAGRLLKLSVIDGHCFAVAELGAPGLSFSGYHIVDSLSDAFVVCFAPSAGLCVPVRLSDFSVLLPLSTSGPATHMDVLTAGDDFHLLSLSPSGDATLAPLHCSDDGVGLGLSVGIRDSALSPPAKCFRCEGSRVVIWNDAHLEVWDVSAGQIARRAALRNLAEDIQDVTFLDRSVLAARLETQLLVLTLSVNDEGGLSIGRRSTADLDGIELCSRPFGSGTLTRRAIVPVRPFGQPRRLEIASLAATPSSPRKKSHPLHLRRLFAPEDPTPGKLGAVAVTCVHVEDDTLYVGDSEGGLTAYRIADAKWSFIAKSDQRIEGAIVRIHPSSDVVFAGTAGGFIGAWSKGDLVSRGTAFLASSPVTRMCRLGDQGVSLKLKGALVCAVDDDELFFVSVTAHHLTEILTIPGRGAALMEVWVQGENVVVTYEDERAEMWDVVAGEVQKELSVDEAAVLISSSAAWLQVRWGVDGMVDASVQRTPPTTSDGLMISLRALADRAAVPGADLGELLDTARMLLAQLFPFVGISKSHVAGLLDVTGDEKWPFAQHGPAVISTCSDDVSPWTRSSRSTAMRQLLLCVLLRMFLNHPKLERHAGEGVLAVTLVGEDAGPSYKPAALDVLAKFWLDRSAEVREAARALFGATLSRTPDATVRQLAERWQARLPVLASPRVSPADQADAMMLIGLIAAEKYKLLSSTCLKDLSSSIVASLEPDAPAYSHAVAIELCSRAFGVFQHFIDAMDLVRSLFGLATGKDSRTSHDLRTMARHAVLQVAAVNPPLFMTTLSYDLVASTEASHRIATMKLVAFMVRKKPRVLHTSLPRLAEAVVKSLDPTHKLLRDATQAATTVILHELVKTYPSIAFHGRTQRLAVGTHEGAVIVYDVKTATRLYVLGGHKRPVTVCSFSPDGHRLVTVSLEEGRAEVWKVATGVLGYLTPGAPPRQGGFGSLIGGGTAGPAAPYRTFPFNVGEEGNMSTAATLEWVMIEWPGERSCRLKIRESALTFAV